MSAKRDINRFVLLMFISLYFSLSDTSFAQEEPISNAHAEKAPKLESKFSGYVKSLNILTKSTGSVPETIDDSLIEGEKNQNLFQTVERVRFKSETSYPLTLNQQLLAKIHYDQQASFGSYVSEGDFRLEEKLAQERQFVDLSQNMIEREGVVYMHRLHRASIAYKGPHFKMEIGRQQISWGVGYFFTPTDLFNPFQSTQLELDERDGTDAVDFQTLALKLFKTQFVYTPRGGRLHPQRFLARFSKQNVMDYEVGVLGGFIHRDLVSGFDLRGNIKNSAVRGELLFRKEDNDDAFVQFTANADYNFHHNIYGMLEYHFNGEGHRKRGAYQRDRLLRGDIRQLAKNYVAAILSRNLTPLVRLENRFILNIDDLSIFFRPEIQYEATENLLLTAGVQIFEGDKHDELGNAKNWYFAELKQSF